MGCSVWTQVPRALRSHPRSFKCDRLGPGRRVLEFGVGACSLKLGFHRSSKGAAARLAVVAWLAAGCGGSVAEPAADGMADGGPQPVADVFVADVFDDATTSDASVDDAIIRDVRIEDVPVSDVAADSPPSIGPCRGPAPASVQCDPPRTQGPAARSEAATTTNSSPTGAAGSPSRAAHRPRIAAARSASAARAAVRTNHVPLAPTATTGLRACREGYPAHEVCLKWPGSACNVADRMHVVRVRRRRLHLRVRIFDLRD